MNNYKDIINMPHHVSSTRKQMSIENRASQFAPFAALSGFEDAVTETARLTDDRKEIDEGLKLLLNEKLNMIINDISLRQNITITYFVPDKKKDGGSYKVTTGILKKVIESEDKIILESGEEIDIKEIIDIKGDKFNEF